MKSTSRTDSSKLDGAGTRSALIRAAVDLFHRKGFANVRMSEIARAAGLTTGAFYYHFESKEQILDLVANYYIDRVSNLAEEIYVRPNLSPEEKLSILIREHCQGVAMYQPHVAVFYGEYKHMSPGALEKAISMNSRFLTFTTRIIEDGVKAGVLRPGMDPKVLALGIIGMGNWMYQWYSSAGPCSVDEIGEMFGTMIMRGLLRT